MVEWKVKYYIEHPHSAGKSPAELSHDAQGLSRALTPSVTIKSGQPFGVDAATLMEPSV